MTGTNLTAVSLFAGIGGFDLALTRAGVRVVAAVEIDPAARKVLRRQFPDVTLFEDVKEVTGDALRAAGFVPRRGLITAGWPCQGNSVAGLGLGLADPRSGLWTHVRRLLADTGAAWFIGENVAGLLSVNGGQDFAVVLDDLAGLGMGFCWRLLDAQHFGVAQQRRRVIVVGRAGGDPRGPVEVLLEPEGRGRDSRSRRSSGQVVAAITTSGIGGRGGPDDNAAQAGHLIPALLPSGEVGRRPMPELPAEAVQAAAEAMGLAIVGMSLDGGTAPSPGFTLAQLAEFGLRAAAPLMTGAGSPAACPSVASESTESAQTTLAAPVYRPGVEEPAEALTALRDTLARVRSHCQQVANGQPWEDYEIGRHDHAKHVLDLLDGAGAVPGEHTGSGND